MNREDHVNRISPAVLVAFLPLVLVVAAYATTVAAIPSSKASQPTRASTRARSMADGSSLSAAGLVAPTAITAVTMPLIVSPGELDGMVTDQARRGSEVGYDSAPSQPSAVYRVADSSITEADNTVMIQTMSCEGPVALDGATTTAAEITQTSPWSPFSLARDSGRLARFSQ